MRADVVPSDASAHSRDSKLQPSPLADRSGKSDTVASQARLICPISTYLPNLSNGLIEGKHEGHREPAGNASDWPLFYQAM